MYSLDPHLSSSLQPYMQGEVDAEGTLLFLGLALIIGGSVFLGSRLYDSVRSRFSRNK